jgi:hypothetical protein
MQTKLWQYKITQDLQVGDTVIVLNDGMPAEVQIAAINKKQGNNVRFFRLNVEDIDNYFAGSVCIHNSEESKASCTPPENDDTKARELMEKCGKNPARPQGCRKTDEEKEEALVEQIKLCNDYKKDGGGGYHKCGPPDDDGTCTFFDVVCHSTKSKIKDAMNAPPPVGAKCGLSDSEIQAMTRAACAAAGNCPGGPAGQNGGNCVSEDTLILIPSGAKAVKHLVPGDVVLSYDIKGMIDSRDATWSLWTSEDLTGNISTSTVISNKNSFWHAWYQILLSNNTELNITYEHPVLVKTEGLPKLLSTRF